MYYLAYPNDRLLCSRLLCSRLLFSSTLLVYSALLSSALLYSAFSALVHIQIAYAHHRFVTQYRRRTTHVLSLFLAPLPSDAPSSRSHRLCGPRSRATVLYVLIHNTIIIRIIHNTAGSSPYYRTLRSTLHRPHLPPPSVT